MRKAIQVETFSSMSRLDMIDVPHTFVGSRVKEIPPFLAFGPDAYPPFG